MTAADLLTQLRAACEEFGDATPIAKLPATEPIQDGYLATKPGPVGASKSALVVRQTADGCVLSLAAKEEGVDDLQRTILKSMYGKRARVIRETRTFPGASTDQLTDNPNEAIETPHDE